MDFEEDRIDHSVSEFYESFGHNLPKIVVVTQGFFGEIVDDVFDRCQVYRIHTVSRQKRIVAKAADRHYSIPLNYLLKMCVVKKHGKLGKEQTLKEVITEHSYPVDVKFSKDQEFDVGGSTTSANRFPQLKLIDEFDEVYFLANTIIDGVLDLRVVPIPLYLSMLRLAEITGIKNQSQEKWNRYTSELTDLVTQSVEFDLTYGNKDIAVYHEESFKADTVYTYIEPRTYSNIFSVAHQFQPTQGPSRQLSVNRKQHGDASGDVYEEIKTTERPISDVMKPLSEVGGELKSFFNAKKRASQAELPVPAIPNSNNQKLPAPTNPNTIDQNENERSPPDVPKRNPATNVKLTPALPPKPNPYVNDIPRGTVAPTTKTVSGTQRPQHPLPTTTASNEQNSTTSSPTPTSTRSMVQSTVMMSTPSQSATCKGNNSDVQTNSSSLDDTFKVEKLSIQELAVCMEKLQLSQYISMFQENMIDGAILKELDTELLKTDFGFKGIEAIRLMKFAREGHIPK